MPHAVESECGDGSSLDDKQDHDRSRSGQSELSGSSPDSEFNPSNQFSASSFTFVEHTDSPRSKRIKDERARKTIRSHIMRFVRQREKYEGKKRLSKKKKVTESENGNIESDPTVLSSTVEHIGSGEDLALSIPVKLYPSNTSPDLECEDVNQREILVSPPSYPSTPAQSQWLSSRQTLRLPSNSSDTDVLPLSYCNPPIWSPGLGYIDPFGTLPGEKGKSKLVDGLVDHCLSVFLPKVFPMERRHNQAQKAKYHVVLQEAISARATFFGYMALTAAYRAMICSQRGGLPTMAGGQGTTDIEFYVMKGHALSAINQKIKLFGPDTDCIDASCHLVGATCTLGDFQEARTHLEGIRGLILTLGSATAGKIGRAGPSAFNVSGWALWADVKVALGLLTRPLFGIPQETANLAAVTIPHIVPPSTSLLSQFESKAGVFIRLSRRLRSLLADVRDLCYFHDFELRDSHGLNQFQHAVFLSKSLLTEHSLLTYPYEIFECGPRSEDDLQIHPLENVTRIAALCMMSCISITTSPATGLGRALTMHLQKAFVACRWPILNSFDHSVSNLLAWTLFLGVQGAEGQPEEKGFLEHLAKIAIARGWNEWEEVEHIMSGFLYLPILQERIWSRTWDRTKGKVEVWGS